MRRGSEALLEREAFCFFTAAAAGEAERLGDALLDGDLAFLPLGERLSDLDLDRAGLGRDLFGGLIEAAPDLAADF